MTTRQVTVTKYVSCDGVDFNVRQECEDHERKVRNLHEQQVYELRCRKRELLYAINDARINARITWLKAEEWKAQTRSAMGKSKYFLLMAEYWRLTSEYNTKRRELREVRRRIGMAIDSLYTCFGHHKKKSSVARLERRRRSLAWRQENTPDKWSTPNKIHVSKLPKEEQ